MPLFWPDQIELTILALSTVLVVPFNAAYLPTLSFIQGWCCCLVLHSSSHLAGDGGRPHDVPDPRGQWQGGGGRRQKTRDAH